MGKAMTLGGGTEATLATTAAFWVIAASTIIAAFAVVQLRDLFRASLFLVVSLVGVAALFVLLRAEFLAVVQVLIYVGAISVLIIFAVLMTRDVTEGSPSNRLRLPAGLLALLFFVCSAFVILNTDWTLLEDRLPADGASEQLVDLSGNPIGPDRTAAVEQEVAEVYSNTVPKIAGLLLSDYVLAFEAASVLLLAALIGAVALVREPDP